MSEVNEARPPPPEWLNRSFIETALRQGENNPQLEVTHCDITFANAVGDGYASDMYRVTATLQGSQHRAVIVKCQPRSGKREEVVRKWGAFNIETKMLTETLPAMYELLERACPGKYQPFSAKCLYHGKEPISFIVLEDLKQSGFTLAKRQEGVDLEHCVIALKTLARFHASSLALCSQDPKRIKSYDRIVFCEDLQEQVAPFAVNAIASLENEIRKWKGYQNIQEKLNILKESFFDRLVDTARCKEGTLNTLIHGDPWVNNMMFKYSDSGIADLRLVDFQTSNFSCPANDIQYFLHTSPSEHVRVNYMEDLLGVYHNTFSHTLHLLGCDQYQISFDEFKSILDDHCFYAVFASVCVMPIVMSDPDHGFDLEEALGGSSEAVKSSEAIYANEAYVKTMKRLLPIFDKKGLLD